MASAVSPRIQDLEDWQKEMQAIFPHMEDIAFVCPKCGRVNTRKEWLEKKLPENSLPQECIGRHLPELGCNWAAYGLFKTMGKGRVVKMPDGHETDVFDFAPMTRDRQSHGE